jgi:hypothetical protein
MHVKATTGAAKNSHDAVCGATIAKEFPEVPVWLEKSRPLCTLYPFLELKNNALDKGR